MMFHNKLGPEKGVICRVYNTRGGKVVSYLVKCMRTVCIEKLLSEEGKFQKAPH